MVTSGVSAGIPFEKSVIPCYIISSHWTVSEAATFCSLSRSLSVFYLLSSPSWERCDTVTLPSDASISCLYCCAENPWASFACTKKAVQVRQTLICLMPERANLGNWSLIAFFIFLVKHGKTFTLLYAKILTNTNSSLNLMYRNDSLVTILNFLYNISL